MIGAIVHHDKYDHTIDGAESDDEEEDKDKRECPYKMFLKRIYGKNGKYHKMHMHRK